MVSEKTLVDMIQEQTEVNTKMLQALEGLNKNTVEMANNLRDMDKTLIVVVEKYQRFSDYMKFVITLSVAQLFTLISIAILL